MYKCWQVGGTKLTVEVGMDIVNIVYYVLSIYLERQDPHMLKVNNDSA